MKPTASRRSVVRASSLSAHSSVSPIHTCPDVGRSRPARQCMNVDLPEPDGPITAVKRPFCTSTLTPPSAVTVVSPDPYTLVSAAVRAAAGAAVAVDWEGMTVLTVEPSRRAPPGGGVPGHGSEIGGGRHRPERSVLLGRAREARKRARAGRREGNAPGSRSARLRGGGRALLIHDRRTRPRRRPRRGGARAGADPLAAARPLHPRPRRGLGGRPR